MNPERKTFWKDDLPRLVAIVIAVATFVYLLYDLTVRGQDFTLLHLWILLVVLALVLGSIASRLRILNFIDFKAEVDSLREETKRELVEIRNQVSAIVKTEATQKQFTIMNLISGSDPQILAQSLEKQYKTLEKPRVGESESGLEPEKDKFFKRVETLITRAFEVFFIGRALQIAIHKNRVPAEAEDNLGTGNIEERTTYLIKAFLDGGIEVFIPIPEEVNNTKRSLEQILKLINIKNKCQSENDQLPPHQEVDKMFDDAIDGLGSISSGIVVFASAAIVSYNKVRSTIKELRDRFGISEDASQSTSNQSSES
jgi:hypothetical protein